MLIKRKRGWELPESAATPESVYLNRRQLMKGAAGGSLQWANRLLKFDETTGLTMAPAGWL